MIEIYSGIILIISVLIMLSSFFQGASLFFNLVLLGLILILMSVDLKKKDVQKYYAVSVFVTAIIFMLSNTIPVKAFLGLLSRASISLFTTAFILVYVLAHLSGIAHVAIETFIERYRK